MSARASDICWTGINMIFPASWPPPLMAMRWTGSWTFSPISLWWMWSWGNTGAMSWRRTCGIWAWKPCSVWWVAGRTSSMCASPCGPGLGIICSNPSTPRSCGPSWNGPLCGISMGPSRNGPCLSRRWTQCFSWSTASCPGSPLRSYWSLKVTTATASLWQASRIP